MRYFICGGGDDEKTVLANKKFNEVVDHTKPILYIPLAMQSERYDKCYEWICWELRKVNVPDIEMVRSIEDLAKTDLSQYGAIFIGGGNTYKLLKELKDSGVDKKIIEYLNNNGLVYGGSAGAIILGADIATCKYSDKNEVGLTDTSGFDLFNGWAISCHFTNEGDKKTALNSEYFKDLSKKIKIIALPEEDTIYYDDGSCQVLGERPYYVFDNGQMTMMNCSEKRRHEYTKIRTDYDLMDFMNSYISYGWVDVDKGRHLGNLKGLRKKYRTGSIDEILETGLGTCIEQAKLIKFTLEGLGLETRMYCYRRYETEEDFDKEVRMHCFVLFRYGDKWYHFEHSNVGKRGIHEYDSLDDAINAQTDRKDTTDIRELTEIPDVPEGLTFKQFNEYVNTFDIEKIKKL